MPRYCAVLSKSFWFLSVCLVGVSVVPLLCCCVCFLYALLQRISVSLCFVWTEYLLNFWDSLSAKLKASSISCRMLAPMKYVINLMINSTPFNTFLISLRDACTSSMLGLLISVDRRSYRFLNPACLCCCFPAPCLGLCRFKPADTDIDP